MAAFRGSNSGVDVSAASTFRFQRRGHAETFCAASGGRHTLLRHDRVRGGDRVHHQFAVTAVVVRLRALIEHGAMPIDLHAQVRCARRLHQQRDLEGHEPARDVGEIELNGVRMRAPLPHSRRAKLAGRRASPFRECSSRPRKSVPPWESAVRTTAAHPARG